MVHLDGVKHRIQAGVREWSLKDNWRRGGACRDRKRLNAKNADDAQMTVSLFVRRDVALIPGKSKRRFRNLDDEEIVIGIRSKPLNRYLHRLNGSVLKDSNRAACTRQARFGSCGDDHFETRRAVILIGGRQQR